MKIYTKKGDTGSTQLLGGTIVKKNHTRLECYGTIDELNAFVGVAKEHCKLSGNGLVPALSIIQSRMLDVGSAVATPRRNTNSSARIESTSFGANHVLAVEQWIDELDEQLPPLKNFILPSGGLASAHLHVARAVCRRAERSVIPLVSTGDVEPAVQIYLNRLSDFLFTAARFAAHKEGNEESIYQKQ